MLKLIGSILVALLAAASCRAAASDASGGDNAADFSRPFTEQFSLYSSTLGGAQEILVALPPDYDGSGSVAYPVLYVLNKERIFGTVRETVHVALPSAQLPAMIIVGIDGPGTGAGRQAALGAAEDAAPTLEAAEDYLGFLAHELIPAIDAKYRTDPADRGLLGEFDGGSVALLSLFRQPEIFSRYVVASPDLGAEGMDLFDAEQASFHRHASPKARVFIGIPGANRFASSRTLRLIAEIRSRGYADLWLREMVFNDSDRFMAFPRSVARGLRSVYCDPPRETGCGRNEMQPFAPLR
ncbi:alpha/beta hydrolase [Erythrobacter sp. AP23]|uniref:alpha/beta hydrolase n=1 Tax=Erythrobacter sp. AP23 TaxID=499656 RepID=UPI00076CA67D|nr:alpha/beta hydrolase-fold protein [Erythrobacter sp. AP23]KWV93766.1 hypothetical protein ASS64_12790 [Erythrobacter sp. AP23]